jgi:3-oxoacyl-(acyl-carrier-protein) synthase
MNLVITGRCKLTGSSVDECMDRLHGRIKPMRLLHTLERLVIAAIGGALDDAGIPLPVGTSAIGLYLGIDRAIEDIKDKYFLNILHEGMLGASPMLFPYTSPNALAAQASIAFDMRGESITMPINNSYMDVIRYSTFCVAGGYTEMAVAGGITMNCEALSLHEGRYRAEFFFIRGMRSVAERGAKIYHHIKAGRDEEYRFD